MVLELTLQICFPTRCPTQPWIVPLHIKLLQTALLMALILNRSAAIPLRTSTMPSLIVQLMQREREREIAARPFSQPGRCPRAISAWGPMLCRLYRVGLQDQPSPGISAAALCARPGHWGIQMQGILFWTALILPTLIATFVRCIKMLPVMVPFSDLCGTRTKRLFATA